METTPAEAPDVAVQQLAALVPPLQLPHSGVTWSHQLDGDTLRKSSLALQPSSAKQAAFKARESVSMYVDDGNKTMQVVEALRQKVGSESGSRPSSVRMGIRGDRVGMATKAALEPSQLETHITSLMRASFGRLKKRYLAVGPDAVLTSSQKDSSVNRLHPSLPTSPRRTPRGPTGPKSPRKAPAATPRSTLTPGLELSQAVAVPTSGTSTSQTVPVPASPKAASGDAAATHRKKHVAIAADSAEEGKSISTEGSHATGSLPALADAGNALSDKASSSGWAALRHEASTGGLGGFTGHKAGWGFGAPPDEPQKSHKMDFTDVAFQMIGTAKKGTAWQPLAVTETYMGLDPQVFNSEVRRRALEWKSNQEADFRAKASATLKERVQAETHAYLTRMGILDTTNPVLKNLQERAHKHAMQRVLRADAFALEHKRVNDWDLSDAMANFADQYRQELREERIDQELKRLKAVQEVAQYRAEAQASRRLLEHQKSVAREHAAIHAALGLKPGEGGELGRTFTPEPTILQELQLVEERIAGKLERALGAANTPLLKPGVARPARPGSGGGRPSSGGRPNSPHSAMATMGRVSPSSRPTSALRRPQSSKHVAMLADSDRAHSSSSAGESQAQDPAAPASQAAQTDDSALHGSDSAAQPPGEADTAISDSPAAAEEAAPAAEVAAAAVPTRKQSFSLKAVIDQTMRRQVSSCLSHTEALGSPRHQIGQGFAKWISRAVGNAGLKEKTEIEDLPAYKLREGDPNAQPRIVYMHKCVELECWPATAVVSQLHLTHINLSYVIMDDKSCEALSRTFPVMQHLKQLCLSQTQLTDSNLDVMLKILKDLDLQVLDLSDNKLTSAACDTLSLALSKPQNPRGWALSGASHLGSRREGPGTPKRPAHTPGKGLNSCLQELNLSGNPIGDEGIAALEEVLCTTKAMTSLVLAHTELTEHSGPVLGRLVEFVPKLAHLDVSWNQLGPLTAEALAGGLAPGGHLVSLDVSWNGLEAGAGLIAAALQKGGGAPLRMLNLSGTRPSDEALLKIALMFQSSSKLQLTHVGLRGNTLGGVSGQCLLRNLHAYAAAAMPAVTVDAQQCSTGSLEPQLAEAPEAKGKKGKAKKGKGKKGEKEDKGKGKEKGKEKGKKEKDDGEGAEAPVIQAVGKHFSLDLSQEQHRAVACLLADHEVQAQGFGRSAWFNATLDGRLLVQGSKWLTPIDLQQWPKALPSRGTLELDVLQLPLSKVPWIAKDGSIAVGSRSTVPAAAAVSLTKADDGAQDHVSDAVADGDAGSDTKTAQQASQQREDAEGGDIDEHLAAVGNYSSGVEGEQSMQGAASLAVPTENLLT
ncbi:TPA: hypothetical protein ACH3X2_013596 [Trebouxia sp. C0005]